MQSLLGWKELEILKNITFKEERSKSEIIKDFKNHFEFLRNKSNSSFYLIFERLEKKGLINITKVEGAGHKNFVSLTNKGRQMIFESMRLSFSYLLPSLVHTVLSELIQIAKIHTKKLDNCIIAYILPKEIMDYPEFASLLETSLPDKLVRKFNLQMFFSGKKNYEGLETVKSSFDNIPLKDDFFDVIISFMTLGFHKKKQHSMLLNEFNRILKPEGKIVMFEIKKSNSIVRQSIEKISGNFDVFKLITGYNFMKFHENEFTNLLQTYFSSIEKSTTDYDEFNIITAYK